MIESYADAFYILRGSWVTLQYMVLSLLGGTVLGLVLALAKVSGKRSAQAQAGSQTNAHFGNPPRKKIRRWVWLRSLADAYTSIFRGTPLLLQLSIVYFGVPQILHFQISALCAGLIAFSLNSGAYLSEVIRAGVTSIDPGQFEAAKVLNISYFHTMKDIILPQALRNTLPSLANESITLLKETALISTLGEEDLMRRSQLVAAEKYTYFGPLLIAAGGYYAMVLILSFLFKSLERRLR